METFSRETVTVTLSYRMRMYTMFQLGLIANDSFVLIKSTSRIRIRIKIKIIFRIRIKVKRWSLKRSIWRIGGSKHGEKKVVRIRIRFKQKSRIRICIKSEKHDPDPQHWSLSCFAIWCLINFFIQRSAQKYYLWVLLQIDPFKKVKT